MLEQYFKCLMTRVYVFLIILDLVRHKSRSQSLSNLLKLLRLNSCVLIAIKMWMSCFILQDSTPGCISHSPFKANKQNLLTKHSVSVQNKHFIWKQVSLKVIFSFNLWGQWLESMDVPKFWVICCEMLFSSLRCSCLCSLCLSALSFVFSNYESCAFGLRSHDWLDHWRLFFSLPYKSLELLLQDVGH